MSYSQGAIDLKTPELDELPRLGDRISFLTLDRVRVEQGRTGVEAWSQAEDGALCRASLPVAQIAVLCFGPGSSVTSPAMATLARAGTSVLFSDAAGIVSYACARPLTGDAKWAAAQARIWVDPGMRLAAARRLYAERFPDHQLPDNVTVARLRAFEGRYMRTIYQGESARYKVRGFRRAPGSDDPVNSSLNRANSIVYGLALSVISALACSPALGFIHHGRAGALIYDLADVYKPAVSIPAAFQAASRDPAARDVGKMVRERIHRQQVLPAMLALLQEILRPAISPNDAGDFLLDDTGFAPGIRNWGGS
jgi:CRISPR-associated protein Cas1